MSRGRTRTTHWFQDHQRRTWAASTSHPNGIAARANVQDPRVENGTDGRRSRNVVGEDEEAVSAWDNAQAVAFAETVNYM